MIDITHKKSDCVLKGLWQLGNCRQKGIKQNNKQEYEEFDNNRENHNLCTTLGVSNTRINIKSRHHI